MVSALFIFSYLPHNTLFFQTPYYQALSGIIGSKFAVLWGKMGQFFCPKCPQTRINADFYLSTDFIVGKIRMSLNPSLQCPTNAYFSGFFAFRDSTEIYVFLLFFVPIGTKLVQDWYKDCTPRSSYNNSLTTYSRLV